MTVIFDGNKYTAEKKIFLSREVKKLKKKGIYPCLASIFLSSDKASVLYTKLKGNVAKSVGIKFIPFEIPVFGN